MSQHKHTLKENIQKTPSETFNTVGLWERENNNNSLVLYTVADSRNQIKSPPHDDNSVRQNDLEAERTFSNSLPFSPLD